jgi:hypothetical protein
MATDEIRALACPPRIESRMPKPASEKANQGKWMRLKTDTTDLFAWAVLCCGQRNEAGFDHFEHIGDKSNALEPNAAVAETPQSFSTAEVNLFARELK